jgi:hypothetical protein
MYIFAAAVLAPGVFIILWKDLKEYENEDHSKEPIFKLRVKQLRLVGVAMVELVMIFGILKELVQPSDW